MELNRRDFFKTVTFATTSLYLSKFDLLQAAVLENKTVLVTANLNVVKFTNLISNEIFQVQSTAMGHDFFQNPIFKNLVYVVPKYEKRISIIDINQKKEIGLVKVHNKDFIFYGHIAFSADGTKFYSPQVNEEKSIGTVVVYDAKTNKPIDTIGNLIGGAHDTQFLSDNKTLVVTSSGLKNRITRVEPSSINLFNVDSKKLVKKYYTDNPRQKLAHLRILSNDEIVILTSPVDVPVEGVKAEHGLVYSNFTDSKKEILREWKIPQDVQGKMKAEVLSSSLNGNQLLVTNPTSGKLLYFDISKRELLKVDDSNSEKIASIKNKINGVVTYNNDFMVVETNAHAKLIFKI